MPAIPTLRTRKSPPSAFTLNHIDPRNLHELRSVDDINTYLPLQLRDPSPRGGGGGGGHSSGHSSSSRSSSSHGSSSGSSSSSSSTTVVVVGGGPRYYCSGNNLLLPVWVIILIVVLVFETMLFCVALGWFHREAKAQRKLLYPSKPRPSLNYSRIWLNAFIVASWLWIPIGLFNLIMERVINPRKGVKKDRKVFRPLVDTNSHKGLETTVSNPYKGAGVGAGAGQDPELAAVKRTNSAYSKIPSEPSVEEVKMKYDTPEDVKVPFFKEKKKTWAGPAVAAPLYPSGGAFAGYAPAPVPAPIPATEAQQPQGAVASYFAMSGGQQQPQVQYQQEQEQGAAASYFAMSGQPQSQNLPSTNPWGRQ
ncbi:hypothetical protein B0T09DRAFT_166077 [Sordaria sp. MPI-SDFR-AT-0083]|nr:hypothetical protein B0T09DRAFT_166077 [Sordaria sp. MPI-SDFR-AT-0083]